MSNIKFLFLLLVFIIISCTTYKSAYPTFKIKEDTYEVRFKEDSIFGLRGKNIELPMTTSGYDNTMLLINQNVEEQSAAGIAYLLQRCDKSIWFVPSYTELQALYKNGLRGKGLTWTSSSYSALNARAIDMSNGNTAQAIDKGKYLHTILIRLR
jgi:hypothetical protein